MLFPLTISIIALNLSLGLPILLQARKDAAARVFFAIIFVFSLLTYVNYRSLTVTPEESLFWIRLVMFFAATHVFFFFVFVHYFERKEETFKHISRKSAASLLSFFLVLFLTLSDYLFKGISISDAGRTEVVPGLLLPLFALWLVSILFFSIRKVWLMYKSADGNAKAQWQFLLIGTATSYIALFIFNFVFSSFLNNSFFVQFTPLFSLPVVIAVGYAVVRHNLFDIKILATQAFIAILLIVFLAKTFFALTQTERVVDIAILLLSAFFGVLLVRSVQQEVHAREQIAGLAKKLTETNWQLARTNEQLRVIDQRKSEFVSIVSHQLRTPITAVKGYTSLLLEDAYGPLTEKQRPQVEKIFISSERLAQMVNDFLDISKIEQGTMKYDIASSDVGAMLSELIEDFLPIAQKKGLVLELIVPENKKVEAMVDAGKLRQIFSNLLDNSIKYTPQGKVSVTLVDDPQVKEIVVRMKDSGVGLSQDDVHHLFGKFTRGSQGQKQNTEGSGLGLYVAKKMLEAMNGRIWVDSEGIGKGSTFVIALSRQEQR